MEQSDTSKGNGPRFEEREPFEKGFGEVFERDVTPLFAGKTRPFKVLSVMTSVTGVLAGAIFAILLITQAVVFIFQWQLPEGLAVAIFLSAAVAFVFLMPLLGLSSILSSYISKQVDPARDTLDRAMAIQFGFTPIKEEARPADTWPSPDDILSSFPAIPEMRSKVRRIFEGAHRGLQVTGWAVQVLQERRTKNGVYLVSMFDGILLRFSGLAETHATTIIKERGMPMGKPYRPEKIEEVQLEDPDFSKSFTVYTDDQVDARTVLDPEAMARLESVLPARGSTTYVFGTEPSRLYLGISGSRVDIACQSDSFRFSELVIFPMRRFIETAHGRLALMNMALRAADAFDAISGNRA